MLFKSMFAAIAALATLASASAATAQTSVQYTFVEQTGAFGYETFVYTSPSFITSGQALTVTPDSCSATAGTCTSVFFAPGGYSYNGTIYDQLDFNVIDRNNGNTGTGEAYIFPQGALSATGTYQGFTINNPTLTATLNVQIVNTPTNPAQP